MATHKHSSSPPLPKPLFTSLRPQWSSIGFFLNTARAAALTVGAHYAGLIPHHGGHCATNSLAH